MDARRLPPFCREAMRTRRDFDAEAISFETGRVRLLFVATLVPALLATSPAWAERSLDTLSAVHDACRDAEGEGTRELYTLSIARFRFERPDPDRDRDAPGRLSVDTSRNLRALRGAVEVYSAEFEPIRFATRGDREEELRTEGHTLRVGFFLGFDGEGQSCVVRAAAGVTTVRMDLAFAELLDAEGRVLAREDTERLRAWAQDREEQAPVLVGTPSVRQGDVAIHRATESVRAAIAACHAEAVGRGRPADAHLNARLTVNEGRVSRSEVELSSLRDRRASQCIANALAAMSAGGTGVATVSITLHHAP